jgi:hypothetical protein
MSAAVIAFPGVTLESPSLRSALKRVLAELPARSAVIPPELWERIRSLAGHGAVELPGGEIIWACEWDCSLLVSGAGIGRVYTTTAGHDRMTQYAGLNWEKLKTAKRRERWPGLVAEMENQLSLAPGGDKTAQALRQKLAAWKQANGFEM